jgi:hypothetical protein
MGNESIIINIKSHSFSHNFTNLLESRHHRCCRCLRRYRCRFLAVYLGNRHCLYFGPVLHLRYHLSHFCSVRISRMTVVSLTIFEEHVCCVRLNSPRTTIRQAAPELAVICASFIKSVHETFMQEHRLISFCRYVRHNADTKYSTYISLSEWSRLYTIVYAIETGQRN